MRKILIVDDEAEIRKQLSSFLSSKGYYTEDAAKGKDALTKVRDTQFDLALLDFRLPDMNGLELLKKIKILSPNTAAIIITGYSDVRIAVKSVRSGAFDYVTKPLYVDEILVTIKNALEEKSEKQSETNEIVFGESKSANDILRQINLVAPTDMTVIITGETGTGKEYVARAIHQKSKRKKKPIIAVDCGALPENLAGSELFGHTKGAFTGAVSNKKGSFEAADKGTLFLDEIGNLTYENQMKLLRVLQEKHVQKIGSNKGVDIDVRVIAATNESLKDAVKDGSFREDLYHRINEFRIHLPPLRERREDILFYMNIFLKKANEDLNKSVTGFRPEVVESMIRYEWHGNLRELRNVIKRSVLMAKTKEIKLDCLPEEITGMMTHHSISTNKTATTDLKSIAEEAERNAIIDVLEKTNHNKTKAAKMLNIDRKTLYNKMKNYDINLDTEDISS